MPPPFEQPAVFCLDSPETGAQVGGYAALKGWCFARTGQIKDMRVWAGTRKERVVIGLSRPDVQDIHGQQAGAHSGFEAWVRVPPGGCLCRFEARFSDGQWTEVGNCQLLGGAPRRVSEPVRRFAFWARAWAGNPESLSLLGPGEQGYILNQLRAKGLTQLDRLAQHTPHPLEAERFPRFRRQAAPLPRFSLVTPSLNQGRYLGESICSVLSQEGVRVDYHVQDGGSQDGSLALLEQLDKQHALSSAASPIQFSWSSEADSGQADAIQKAFERTEGKAQDLMAWLNADDQLMPGALRFVAEYFARHPEVDVIYGHRVIIDQQGQEIGRWTCPRRSCDNLCLHDFIPQETLFWRRALWDKVGGLDRSFQFAMDWDLLLRFRQKGARFARLPWHLGLFRAHEAQKSQVLVGNLGLQEMTQLRLRSLGRLPSQEELEEGFRRCLLDSALVAALMKKGLRV